MHESAMAALACSAHTGLQASAVSRADRGRSETPATPPGPLPRPAGSTLGVQAGEGVGMSRCATFMLRRTGAIGPASAPDVHRAAPAADRDAAWFPTSVQPGRPP